MSEQNVKAPNYFEHYRNIYSDQTQAISDQ